MEKGEQANYEQNVNDAITVFHKLQTGLDVNVRFTGYVLYYMCIKVYLCSYKYVCIGVNLGI